MFRRIKRGYAPRTPSNTPEYSKCETSQLEPNLHDILVAFQQGKDVSQFVTMPAAKATAEQQFKNRVGKVDPLTEFSEFVKSETRKANEMVDQEKKTRKSQVTVQPAEQSSTQESGDKA